MQLKSSHHQRRRPCHAEIGMILLIMLAVAATAAPSHRRFSSRASNSFTTPVATSGRNHHRRVFFHHDDLFLLADKEEPICQSNNDNICLRLRGGSQDPSSATGVNDAANPPPQYESPEYGQQQQQQQQQPPQPQYQQQQELEYSMDQPPPLQEETFQEKVDSWRTYQMQHAESQRTSVDPRDEQGKMKLLTSVTKGSRAVTFFILMWRNVHLYEVVDQKFKGSLRFLGVLPLTILFIANLAGVVASVTASGHGSKKRLKAILNLDKVMEIFLILSNIFQLIFTTSHLVPRELYISHILHSVFFIIQCQTVTRFVWDEALPVASRPSGESSLDEDEGSNQYLQPQQPFGAGTGNNYQQNRH